jgi:hypothetical protein
MECTIKGVATELAIQVGQNKTKAIIPPKYHRFAKVFSDEEAS